MTNKRILSCLIVDDEPLAVEGIKFYLSKLADISIADVCYSALEANQKLKENQIDLLFLDINMPDISGLDWLESIIMPPMTILTTAYSEYAMDSYRLNVVDYLLKPISMPRLVAAVEKAHLRKSYSSLVESPINVLYIKHADAHLKINICDILFVESMQNYVKIYTVEKTYIAHQTMSSISDKLNKELFYRIHKSYLINTTYINSIKGNRIFILEHELPLSKHRREDFFKTIVHL
ncbi:LytR/AlgR family response regulator transcription factor [Sphingobacterium faecium]|jgi:DNA-binding LytR/AlgR family response regulator